MIPIKITIIILFTTLCSAFAQAKKTYDYRPNPQKKTSKKIVRKFPNGIDTLTKKHKLLQRDSLLIAHMEDSLFLYINTLQITDSNSSMNGKINANKMFLKNFQEALKKPFSFAYAFEKLQENISIVYPDDSSFRIFTWQYTIDDLTVLKQGVLQMNTIDGSFKIFPLFDRSRKIQNPLDTITTNTRWIGAMYYQIITNHIRKKTIYTLLGIDENSILSTKKWIEILQFGKDGKPYFGGNYFYFPPPKLALPDPTLKKRKKRKDKDADKVPLSFNKPKANNDRLPPVKKIHYKRYQIEYQKMTIANLRYDNELEMIIFDHLVPPDEYTKERKHTFTIDGNYEGFIWKNNRWEHIDEVFDFHLQEGQAPKEKPLNFKNNGLIQDDILNKK